MELNEDLGLIKNYKDTELKQLVKLVNKNIEDSSITALEKKLGLTKGVINSYLKSKGYTRSKPDNLFIKEYSNAEISVMLDNILDRLEGGNTGVIQSNIKDGLEDSNIEVIRSNTGKRVKLKIFSDVKPKTFKVSEDLHIQLKELLQDEFFGYNLQDLVNNALSDFIEKHKE